MPVVEGDVELEPQQVGQPEGQAHHRQVERVGRAPVDERTEPDGHLEGAVGGPHAGPSVTWPIRFTTAEDSSDEADGRLSVTVSSLLRIDEREDPGDDLIENLGRRFALEPGISRSPVQAPDLVCEHDALGPRTPAAKAPRRGIPSLVM